MLVLLYRGVWPEMSWPSCCYVILELLQISLSSLILSRYISCEQCTIVVCPLVRILKSTRTKFSVWQCCAFGIGHWCNSLSSFLQHRYHLWNQSRWYKLSMFLQNKVMNLNASACEKAKEICCNLDVWGILVTVILQVCTYLLVKTRQYFLINHTL